MPKTYDDYPCTLPSHTDIEHVMENLPVLSSWLLDENDTREIDVIFENICNNQFQHTLYGKLLEVVIEAVDYAIKANEMTIAVHEMLKGLDDAGITLVMVDMGPRSE